MRRGLASATVTLTVTVMLMSAPTAMAKEQTRPAEPAPVAHAACPWCIPAAIAIVRGATLLRAATAVRAVVNVSRYASTAFRRAVSGRRLRAAVRSARTIKRRGRDWVRRNWNRIGKPTRACIKGAGLLTAEQIIDGGFVTEKEFDAWLLFYYPLLNPVDKAEFKSAISWKEPLETAAAGCVVGWLAFDRS